MIENPLIFITTIFILTITPGPCMILALNSGLTVGLKRTQIMGLGDYTGLFIYTTLSGVGVGALLSNSPVLLQALQYIGAGYLLFLGYKSFIAPPIDFNNNALGKNISNSTLFKQGFISLIANPKAILFYGSFFPQFINTDKELWSQLSIMIPLIILSEFIGVNAYAIGGKSLRHTLKNKSGKIINRTSGLMLTGIGIWILLK